MQLGNGCPCELSRAWALSRKAAPIRSVIPALRTGSGGNPVLLSRIPGLAVLARNGHASALHP